MRNPTEDQFDQLGVGKFAPVDKQGNLGYDENTAASANVHHILLDWYEHTNL